MSRFSPEEYKAEGGFSLLGVPVLLAALCAAAVGLGWLASFIGQAFYLILLFPIGIGAGLVFVGLLVGKPTKMRNPLLAGLFGLISSAVAIVSLHYFDYQRTIAGGPIPGINSFLDYMHLRATIGETISGSNGKGGFNLGYIGSCIYWGVELLIVAFMATLGMIGAAVEPFCSVCNSWKKERKLGQLDPKEGDVAALLREGEIERLKDHDPSPTAGELVLNATVCPNCNADVPITVKLVSVTRNAKKEEERKELVHLTYPGEALADLEAVFVSPASVPGDQRVQAPGLGARPRGAAPTERRSSDMRNRRGRDEQ
jgi:hypothetical protein